MYEQIQNQFSLIASIISKVNILPFSWNSDEREFHHLPIPDRGNENKEFKQILFLRLTTRKVFIFFLICQEIASNFTTGFNGGKLYNWFAILTLLAHNAAHHTCLTERHEIVLYVNELFRFLEKNTLQLNTSENEHCLRAKFIKQFARLCVATMFFVPAGYVFGLLWWDTATKSSIVGYWILRQFGNNLFRLLLKIIIFSLNYWSWQVNVIAGVFCYCGIQIVCTYLLIHCITTMWKVEEAGNAMTSAWERAVIYKGLQIIAILQTEVQSGSTMTMIILTPTLGVAVGSATVVGMPWTPENAVLLLISVYVAFCSAFALLVLLGGHAEVCEESKRMLSNIRRLQISKRVAGMGVSRKEHMIQQRFWWSCANLIKVTFGVNNYVENDTPLNCLNWAVAMAVQLMLMKR